MHKLRLLIEHNNFTLGITALILLNAVTLGLETSASITARFGEWLHLVDRGILVLFTLELSAKLLVYRLGFFRSGWNWFDLLIVGIAWAPATGALSVLRAFRIFRIMRLLSVVPQLRRVIAALAHSIPGMISILGVLMLIFYVAAVLATKLFGGADDANMQEWFGSVGASAYTLFQIMTLESWSMGIVRPTMQLFPHAWLFFVPFIVVTSFAVLNLFIGIIVDALQSTHALEQAESPSQELAQLTRQNARLSTQLARLEQKIDSLDARNRNQSQKDQGSRD